MKIHKDLKKYYKSCAAVCPKQCIEVFKKYEKEHCVNFVSCGISNICDMPCKRCLVWTGYGGKETVKEVIKRCLMDEKKYV